MCIQNLHSALDLAMTFCDPGLLDSRAWGVFQREKKQFESVRGDGYQQWKAESWLHEGLRLKVNECLYIAALQFEPHAHKRNEREKLMPL